MSKPTRPVTLAKPIKLGKKEVRDFVLTEPSAGQMRGLKLAELLQMDVSSMIVIIPRIASPALSEAQVAALDPAQLTAFATEVIRFFATEAQLAEAGA